MENGILQGELLIPFINADCRFWMIRTKGGYFYEEFIRNEFIAIGWNYLLADTLKTKMTGKDLVALKECIKNVYKTNHPGNALKKCDKFIKEFKHGDIAMIVDNGKITFAFIGDYYEEQDQRFSVDEELNTMRLIDTKAADKGIMCPFIKRRKISIIRTLNTNEPINPYLFKAMVMNRHSLSCLDDYSGIILSSCFDVYQIGDRIAMTFRVKKNKGINTIDFADLLRSVTVLLTYESNLITPEDITTQSTLNSPGDVVINFLSNITWDKLALIYLAVFGGSYNGFEFPSLLSIAKEFINAKTTRAARSYDLENKRLVNESLELDNQKKRFEIQRMQIENQVINENLSTLIEASRKLEILPFSDSILPLQELKLTAPKKKKA